MEHKQGASCRVMVFNATFNNMSVLLMEETGVPGENHDLPQTLSHNVVSSTHRPSVIRTHNLTGDRYLLHR